MPLAFMHLVTATCQNVDVLFWISDCHNKNVLLLHFSHKALKNCIIAHKPYTPLLFICFCIFNLINVFICIFICLMLSYIVVQCLRYNICNIYNRRTLLYQYIYNIKLIQHLNALLFTSCLKKRFFKVINKDYWSMFHRYLNQFSNWGRFSSL